jgi:arylsulfatase A-like enzyme
MLIKQHQITSHLAVALLGCFFGFAINTAQLAAENVLLIVADDLGADSVAAFSPADSAPTPTLNMLASTGVRFTNCWANPTCTPSRAAMLTGRHGFRTGIGEVGMPIQLEEDTLADAFSNANYTTACIGKWHLSDNGNGGALNPNLMGFDHYSGSLSGGIGNYYSWDKTVNGTSTRVDNYSTTENVNDAADWIDTQADNPWFMWLAFNAPHSPFHLPPSDLHTNSELSGTDEDIAANPRPYYEAMIEAMDTEIGRLIESMDPEVLANTTIIFVGDNGTPGKVDPNVYLGSKGTLWEGGVRVPCIVWSSKVNGDLNRTHDALIHLTDVFRTALDTADIGYDAIPDGAATDSESFAAYLSDPQLESFHNFQFSERFADPTDAKDGKAIRNHQYKLIRYDSGDEAFTTVDNELNNLLTNGLNDEQQANYDQLNTQLDGLLNSDFDEISYDSFESDWGSFTANGADLSRLARHASDGRQSANVQNTDSFETASGIDLSGYSQLEIKFTFRLVGMDASEGISIEYFDGTNWNNIGEYTTDDHDDSTTYNGQVLVDAADYDFPTDAKIRFTSLANRNRDDAYIDEISVRAK